ncbi:Signal transduction histidine-protein kinase BarA [Anaerohalosphaera lusitana]|uniref:histidine kinase n=1 Tax=Anaerohalosphaera lusitana TaxID=1936003 RepID=A0A1U9NIK8_9BACT|nr:ATP-binding protein [Anaerohalosphaera lusitana]AQT67763.1 Signal transduction histidine-protein kinase BarA [Anaerohalosphaera lusitana]
MQYQENIRVLIVEDDPSARELVERVLRKSSDLARCHIQAAPNLASARQLLRENSFDNILLDLGLPDSAGTETLEKIRDIDPNVSIVVISGNDDNDTSIRAIKLGADYYIVKNKGMHEVLPRSICNAIRSRASRMPNSDSACEVLESKLRNSEQLLKNTRSDFMTIFDSVPAAIWYRDREGTILRANKTAAESVGKRVKDLIGKNYYDIFSSAAQTARSKDLAVIESGETIRGDVRCFKNHLDNVRYALVDRIPYKDSSGDIAGVIVFALDITDRKISDENLAKAREQLEAVNSRLAESAREANELAEKAQKASETKSRFLASVTHEIRTPINSILGFADLLQDEPLSTQQKHCVQMISSASNSLLDLINDLLDFSKIEAGKLSVQNEPVSIEALLTNVFNLLKPQANAQGIDLKLNLRPGLPANVQTDPARLKQCLINLLGNAVKFTEQGSVCLCAQAIQTDGKHSLAISVRDTGIGIPADKQEMIFDAFAQADITTSSKYGGTGLGLAVTAKLVDLLNGTIDLDSAPGKGSTFTINLPLQHSSFQKPAAPKQPAHIAAPTAAVNEVFVLTNDSHNSMLLSACLGSTPYHLRSFHESAQLLQTLQRIRPALLIIDSDLTTEQTLQALPHELPAILLGRTDTLPTDPENIRQLPKPLTRKALANTVSDMLPHTSPPESSSTNRSNDQQLPPELRPLLEKLSRISRSLKGAAQRNDWEFIDKVSQILNDIAGTSGIEFFENSSHDLNKAAAARQPDLIDEVAAELAGFCNSQMP